MERSRAIVEFIDRREDAGIDELVFTTVTADTVVAMREPADAIASR